MLRNRRLAGYRRRLRLAARRVDDITVHPAFRDMVHALAGVYDLQNSDAHRDEMTYIDPESGVRTSLSWLIPTTFEDSSRKRRNSQLWNKFTWGQLGRSPDVLAPFICNMVPRRDQFAAFKNEHCDFGENILNYYRYCRDNDLFLTHALGDPQVDRSTQPQNERRQTPEDEEIALHVVEETAEGVIVSGGKQLSTAAVHSNETYVSLSATFFARNDPRFVLAFSIPTNSKGLKILAREPVGRWFGSWGHPFQALDEQDCMLFFERVLVPWDPEKDELGAASKNLQYNPDEAHKLLMATGLSLPIRSTWNFGTGNASANPLNEGMIGLMQDSGDFQFASNVLTNDAYFERVRNTGGDFDGTGIAFYFDHHDFDWTMMLKYHPKSTDFWMRIAGEDPKMTDFVNRQRSELDNKKRETIFQDEFTALAEDGASYVQLDSLHYVERVADKTVRPRMIAEGEDPDHYLNELIRLDNIALAGIRGRPGLTVGLHMCRGNARSRWHAEGDYEPIAEKAFQQLNVDRFLLEYDTERAGGFEPLRFVPKDKKVVLGLISSKVPELESVDQLRRRVEEAAKFIPIENLAVSPQCGFASTQMGNLLTWDEQRRKLELVVELARKALT